MLSPVGGRLAKRCEIRCCKTGSRREELNTPSTDYDSVALTLSCTGELIVLQRTISRDSPIKPSSTTQKYLKDRLGNQAGKASIEAQPDEHAANGRQWNVIPREPYLLKAIPALEFY